MVSLFKILRAVSRDQAGVTAVVFALMLPMIVGFMGLGVEVAMWYDGKRTLQTAADAAAMAGTLDRAGGSDAATITATATREATRNGWTAADGTIAVDPAYAGDNSPVEVSLTRNVSVLFSSIFLGNTDVTLQARAVGRTTTTSSGSAVGCVLALDSSATNAIYFKNNAASTNANCIIISNSSASTSLYLENNAYINGPVQVVGNWYLSNNAALNGSPNTAGATATADPYASVPTPTASKPSTCTAQSGSGSNNITRNLTPGRFCNGWDFKNNVTLNLSAGTYYIESQLSIQNNVVINATGGVTIALVGNYAMYVKNNATLNITAPTSGTYSGLAFISDSNATSTLTQTFDNNAVLNITGAIYFPNQILELENNASGTSTCTQYIARKISMSNNATIGSTCTGTGTASITTASSTHVTVGE